MILLLCAALLDPQIAGIVSARSEAAISRAEVARELSRDARVRAFANALLGDEGQSQAQMTSLGIVHERTEQVAAIFRASEATEAKLRATPAASFDRAFAETEVAEEQAELDELDQALLPAAHDATLKQFLQQVRKLAAAHLADARKLLARP
jgi:predicted outer membrane protein